MRRSAVVRDYGGVSAADRRAERRHRLLAAGRAIWGESGVAEVTVRGVCGAAGLIPRYFYEQFDNRDALLFAVSDDVRDQLVATMLTAGVGNPGRLDDKLRAALQAFLGIIAADPHIHRIATGDVSGVPGLAQHRTQILDIVTDLVVAHAPDVLDGDPPEPQELRRSALFMVGGVNQLIEAWLHDPRESAAELATVAANLCLATVHGLTQLRQAQRTR